MPTPCVPPCLITAYRDRGTDYVPCPGRLLPLGARKTGPCTGLRTGIDERQHTMGKHEAPEPKRSVGQRLARHALNPVVHIIPLVR